MDEVAAAYEQLVERFTRWAQTEENVRAAVVIGSRARVDHPADEWSDLDVIILASDPQPYWATSDWLHNVGEPWLTFVEPTPDGRGFERRVLFAGGLDVDFAPSPVDEFRHMLEQGVPPDVADVIRRGVRVLLDKDGLAECLEAAKIEPPPASPPAESEFLNLVNDFWYHTVWTGKHLRRGELWWAKSCCDVYLKHLLRRMMEWHARASGDEEVDTWMRGRFLEEWADPRAVESLPSVFARYEEEDVWRALEATMELFGWLAAETADGLGYAYPFSGEERARELVRGLFSERGACTGCRTVKITRRERAGRSGRLAVGCSAAVLDPTTQRILLVRRADSGRWAVPGGYMEPGESVTEACAREVLEETGVRVRVGRLLAVYTSPHVLLEYAGGNRLQLVVLHFAAEPIGGALSASDETTEVGYFPRAEIGGMDIGDFNRQRVDDAYAAQATAFVRDDFTI